MKKLIALSLTLTTLCFAVGPRIPFILTFSSNTSEATGHWLYWRSSVGVYNDTLRYPMSTNAATGFDLRVLGLPKGVYFIAVSNTNSSTESDLSTEFKWVYQNPPKPINVEVNTP